jgi:predicted metal-binding membrane protein
MALEFRSQAALDGGLLSIQSLQLVCGLALSPEATKSSTLFNLQAFWALFTMWTVMQIGMMSPTAVPMVLMHTKVERHSHPQRSPYAATAIFFLGYIIVWAAFSAVFAVLQLGLQSADLLSPLMASNTPWLASGILIAAGLFQFSPLKQACLNQCRSPVTYLMTEWRNGRSGALLMGLKHGLHCVGCCWVLMALLFVAGVMNLFWMAIITAFVLIEKLLPNGDRFGRFVGVGFIVWGILILIV